MLEKVSLLDPGEWLALIFVFVWLAFFISPFGFLVPLILILGCVLAIWKKLFVGLAVLLVFNPFSFFFWEGAASYFSKQPQLVFVGLPRLESFNPDPETRCGRNGGGCFVTEGDLIVCGSHNLALTLMSRIFGPPKGAYSGPYPTKEKAAAAVSDSNAVPITEFLSGEFQVNGERVRIEKAVARRVVEGLNYWLPEPDRSDYWLPPEIRCTFYQDRCLIVKLYEEMREKETIILFDKWNGRPFAYYELQRRFPRHPPVQYSD